MLVLSNDDLVGLLSPLRIIEAVEAALRAQDAGTVVAPNRLHLERDGNTLLAMPAMAAAGSGIKIVSVAPGNTALAIPVVSGLMVLNDARTAAPIAIMNAAALTAQRTGAVGALGVKYMTPEDTRSVGIVGSGVQGAWQAVFASAVRPIEEIFVFARAMTGFSKFAATVQQHAPRVRIEKCADVRELLARTNVVIAATTSVDPVLPDEPQLLQNKHFISVGSFTPAMQELPDAVFRLAGQIAIDTENARREAGDVINATRGGLLREADVFSIAECVTGRKTIDTARTTAYKSVGAALYDLFVAQAFHDAARRGGLGREISL